MKLSLKEMCEVIERSKILGKQDGTYPTAEEIFTFSPTGELFMIPEWYQKANVVLDIQDGKRLCDECEGLGFIGVVMAKEEGKEVGDYIACKVCDGEGTLEPNKTV